MQTQQHSQTAATAAAHGQLSDLDDDDDVEEIESDEEDRRKAAERAAGWRSSSSSASASAASARQPVPSAHLDPRLRPPDDPPAWHSGLPFAPHIDLNDVAHVRVRGRNWHTTAESGSAELSSHSQHLRLSRCLKLISLL